MSKRISFYTKYCDGFTEDIFNELRRFCSNSTFGSNINPEKGYEYFKTNQLYFCFDNVGLFLVYDKAEVLSEKESILGAYGIMDTASKCERLLTLSEVEYLVDHGTFSCEECLGHGGVMKGVLYPNGHHDIYEECSVCGGSGEIEVPLVKRNNPIPFVYSTIPEDLKWEEEIKNSKLKTEINVNTKHAEKGKTIEISGVDISISRVEEIRTAGLRRAPCKVAIRNGPRTNQAGPITG